MKKVLISSIIAVALALSFTCGNAFAGNLPSSKVAVAGGTITALGKATADTGTTSSTSDAQDTGWITIMQNYIKTPKDKGLAFDVSLQCGLYTFTGVKSKGGDKDTSQATGRISVRVKLTHEDAPGSPVYAEPSADSFGDGVTYSYRLQKLSATFQGIIENCIDPDTGTIDINDSCLDFEEVSLLFETMEANAFNFYLGNTESGIYKIEVQARAQANADLFDAQNGSAKGEAYVGLGSMLVETVRLIHGAEYETGGVELQ